MNEYIDYQEVSPSLEPCELGSNWGSDGVLDGVEGEQAPIELIPVPLSERVLTKLHDPVFQQKVSSFAGPVFRAILLSGGVMAVLGVIGYGLYTIGVALCNGAVWLWGEIVASEALFYIGVGAFVLLAGCVAYWINGQMKQAVRFTDFDTPEADAPGTKANGVVINHNHHYYINQK
jgi:hypothetical protein